jgi:hypothetical protein
VITFADSVDQLTLKGISAAALTSGMVEFA